ncbi:type VI secretion system Vgr family protein [Reinekea marinisedimentorum]|uniref:Type VI secretion system secreted protein VgrG n=1 Tax=Reinekea marinisedimentorum TaxID=230495 RepID=A0A4V2UJS7_9GAMM|nr:type VI secretion system tip protein TssI/VgrG [Reinekea marinisedimentorum]TCS41301.1 type VI secretion system secreted protein VgrG [Reinekea marinisedimentorum]
MIQSVAEINRAVRQIGMADESEYFIQIDSFTDDAFIVENVQVTGWNLAESDYSIDVKILALQDIDPQSLLGKKAVVSFLWRGELSPVHSTVFQISGANGNGNYEGYRLTLKSPLWALKNQYHNRVFLEESALQIAKNLMTEFVDGQYTLKVLAGDVEPYPMTVQYKESDWDFIHRILLRDGIMLHQHQTTDGLEVILFDDIAQMPYASEPLELPYRSARGAAFNEESVSLVKQVWRIQPQKVQIADYQFPSSTHVFAESQTDSSANMTHFRWGDNLQSDGAAQKLADGMANACQANANTIVMHSNCRGLQPGMNIELTGHSDLNGQYIITKLESTGNQSAATSGGVAALHKGYSNIFIAIPAGQAFLPLYKPARPIATSITATIASEVDDAGLYRVHLPFDQREAGDDSSLPTRLLQPFGGNDHGMHFPLTVDTEVVLSFENGDIDRPTIMGAVYNDQSPDVVTSENAYQNLIRTRGKHEFLMDDSPGEERIQLNTAEQKNRLQLNATADAHLAELHSEEGDLEIYAGKNMQAQSGADMTIEVGGNQEVTVKGDYSLMTEEGDITHQAGNNLQLTAQEDLSWVTEEGDLNVQVGGQWVVEAADGCSTHVVSGDQSIVVEGGSYQLEASSDVSFSAGGSLTFTQGSGTIQIDSSGNLTLEGPSVAINAASITLKAGSIGSN